MLGRLDFIGSQHWVPSEHSLGFPLSTALIIIIIMAYKLMFYLIDRFINLAASYWSFPGRSFHGHC